MNRNKNTYSERLSDIESDLICPYGGMQDTLSLSGSADRRTGWSPVGGTLLKISKLYKMVSTVKK